MTGQGNRIHATCVALPDGEGGWSGVLLRGPSGAGKSDLALRLIDGGARLVADDQTALRCVDGVLMACAPESLAGKIEVRGVGIMEMPYLDVVSLVLACDLVAAEKIDRYPDPRNVRIGDVELPLLTLASFEASAPAKLRLGVEAARHGIVGKHP
ncbi:MAG: HPr kinase/phosphatase C-terminal domain-containing protein [Proteobacteria bacterium]|nr:HPr kinase/phosphatase C-terminal domain-containing protein [Pseudomonadota bacterium]